MKTRIKKLAAYSIILTALTGLFSCENMDMNATPTTYTTVLDVMHDGVSPVVESELKSVFSDEPITQTDDEALLLHMLDEEKLARDVYNALYLKWDVQIFSNIAKAEQKHLNAILLVIENYTVLEAEEGNAGEYLNDDFALLYNQLVTKGSESLEQAYTVGALIEELDIYDLALYLGQTSNENITIVFENLMRGSRNHLRAFNKYLVQLGIQYVPQYIDEVTFDEIVNSPMEQGKRYAKRNQNGDKGNRGNGNGGSGNGSGNSGGNGDGSCDL